MFDKALRRLKRTFFCIGLLSVNYDNYDHLWFNMQKNYKQCDADQGYESSKHLTVYNKFSTSVQFGGKILTLL